MNTIIDAHVHLWDPSRGDYGWLTAALPGLYRRVGKEELHALTTPAGVKGVVLVQAAPTAAESDYLLSIARQTPWILGVVGWVDFDADDIEAIVATRSVDPKFVGVRPMLQDLADPDWIVDPRRDRALSSLASHGLVFDALIRTAHMNGILQVAQRYPELAIVIDHAAKPAMNHTPDVTWRQGLRALATCPNVVCKFSGLLTEAPAGAEVDVVLRYADEVVQAFGPARVLWGSDWPVLTEAATYDRWFSLTQRALSSLSDTDRNAIMGGNAARVYKLKLKVPAPAILLHPNDNVLVCCRAVTAGERFGIGSGAEVEVLQDIDLGHKLARRALSAGDKVIKYGAPIGSMTTAVAAGGWIHLHNMKSDYISAHTRAAQDGSG